MTAIVSLHLPRDLCALESHFAALDGDALRYRFCAATKPEGVANYIGQLQTRGIASYGIFDASLALVAVCQLGRSGDDLEVGLTVLAASRRKGFAMALLKRSTNYARAKGLKAVVIHCLADNTPMLSLARRLGMVVGILQGEADGRLMLRAGTVLDFREDVSYDQEGIADTLAKHWQRSALVAGST